MVERNEREALAVLDGRVGRFYAEYAAAVDAGDEPSLRALAVEGVELTRAGGTEQGVEAFLDVYRAHWSQGVALCQHSVSNVLTQARADGGVRATAHFRAFFFEPTRTRMVVGWYEDDLVDGVEGLRLTHKRNHVQRILVLPAATVVGEIGP